MHFESTRSNRNANNPYMSHPHTHSLTHTRRERAKATLSYDTRTIYFNLPRQYWVYGFVEWPLNSVVHLCHSCICRVWFVYRFAFTCITETRERERERWERQRDGGHGHCLPKWVRIYAGVSYMVWIVIVWRKMTSTLKVRFSDCEFQNVQNVCIYTQ